jgi:hypothetical protein
MFFFFKKKCKQKSLLGVESNQVYTMEIEKKKKSKISSNYPCHQWWSGKYNLHFQTLREAEKWMAS